jgi:ADP-ribosylglycohydrolase
MTCLSALASTKRLGDLPTNDSKGCGTVMRVAPVGIVRPRHAAFDLGADVSRLTHTHPSGYIAGGFVASLIATVIEGVPLRDAISSASALLGDADDASEVRAAVDAAVRLAASGEPATAEAVETLGEGWVAEEALAIALYAALVADDLEQGVCLAVNHSGDSDSTGAVAGNLLGAMLGVEAIPARWLEILELRDVIERVAHDLLALRGGTFDAQAEVARYPDS